MLFLFHACKDLCNSLYSLFGLEYSLFELSCPSDAISNSRSLRRTVSMKLPAATSSGHHRLGLARTVTGFYALRTSGLRTPDVL